MATKMHSIFDRLLRKKPDAKGVQDAFRAIGEEVLRRQEEVESKKKKIEEDAKRGSRLTKRRVYL